MKSEKDLSKRMLMGTSTLSSGDEESQSFEIYYLPPDFPAGGRKKEVCQEHISEGRVSELMGDFDMGGVRFPERNEPQEITTQISCKGVGCILKTCELTITQYGPSGEVFETMRAV